jgi:hypothetical protein
MLFFHKVKKQVLYFAHYWLGSIEQHCSRFVKTKELTNNFCSVIIKMCTALVTLNQFNKLFGYLYSSFMFVYTLN